MNPVNRFARIATLLLAVSAALPALALDGSGDFIRPREGQALTYTHVRFWWQVPPVSVVDYRLTVVVDDGSADPFATSGPPVVEVDVPAGEPRHVVTSGLEFDESYAWRVRSRTPAGPVVGPIRRFSIAPLPEAVPTPRVLAHVAGKVQPGLTLIQAQSVDTPPTIPVPMALAADADGTIVWYRTHPETRSILTNIQQYPDGRISYIAEFPGSSTPAVRGAVEDTLDGRVLWRSPMRDELVVHHDNGRMPDGSPLVLVFHELFLPEDDFQHRRSDRIVILDRHTGEETWAWRAIDHVSLLDGDHPLISRWTHGNAALYSPADDSVYYSARNISRLTRIDFRTRDVVWNMGRLQPSGEAPFGDGLFTSQHAPERQPDGKILLFDNGNLSIPALSRAVEIELDDLDAPTSASVAWDYVVHDEFFLPILSGFLGDADRLPNGNTLINAGQQAFLYEVAPDGELVWWLKIGNGFRENVNYRAKRIEGLNVDTPGDSDGDWDIDLMDIGAAQLVAGGGVPASGFPARLSDTDGDGDVDVDDASHLVYWMTAPVD